MKLSGRGSEWLVDASGCRPEALRSVEALASVFAAAVRDLGLNVMAGPFWHRFPGEGGVTGVAVLSESHLTCHTFPEEGFAAFNLYSCGSCKEWPWEKELALLLGATSVEVRRCERGSAGS